MRRPSRSTCLFTAALVAGALTACSGSSLDGKYYNSASGEFAIIVRTRLKGHGLGWAMMQHMIAYAKEKRLSTVRGQVLAENVTMLAMCEQLGFYISDDPLERGVKQVALPLDDVPAAAMA